jgi:hypothetical protein
MADNNNPDFHRKRKKGFIVMSDMVLDRHSRVDPSCTFTIGPHPNWGSNVVSGDFSSWVENRVPDPSASLDADLASMRNIALNKAMARIVAPSMQSGEALNDLAQTISMLKNPFKGARTLLAKMAKYRSAHLGKTAASALKASGNAWLEYRYGWKPLLMDADMIISSALVKRDYQKDLRLVSRAQENLSRDISQTFQLLGGLPRVDVCDGTVRVKRTMRASAGVIYCYRNSKSFHEMGKFFGTRPRDLPSVLWEIIPYSFVADWFVGVGDWLQAVTPDPSIHFLGNWITTVDDKEITFSDLKTTTYISVSPATTYYCYPTGASKKSVIVSRTVNQSVAAAPPVTTASLSLTHSIDGVALFLPKILGSLKTLKH